MSAWDHPVFATREEFDARLAEVYAEGGTDEAWWYLSFATDAGFLGGLYIRADHGVDACVKAGILGLNPGGEVQFVGPIPDEALEAQVAVGNRYRLLTAEEVDGS